MVIASEYFAHVEKLKGHSNLSIWKLRIVVLLEAADLYSVDSTEFREGEQDKNWAKRHRSPEIHRNYDRQRSYFHMINNSASLTNVTGIESEIITSKKNENLCAEFKVDIEYQECVLKNVLYFVTFLDDYTHFSVLCLIKNKLDVCDTARNYIVEAESIWNSRVYKLRCDVGGGGEYVANELTDWCREKGVKIDYAPAATPQLNERAERLNRTLMDKTRALLFDSDIEKELWGEALRTATYLLNRSPYATVDTTPAELWYGERQYLSNLKLFGSLAYAKKLRKLGKLDKRRDKFIMVAYTTNGYKLWNLETREISLSRDVTFVELRNPKKSEVVSSRWVFKIKDDNRHKARLVARGCEQKAGLDCSETFSSVVSLNTLRSLIAYTKKENMSLKQFDIKTTFLYGNLEQDVFMLVPEGFEDEQGSVVKLKKSRYDLKQAPRAWNKRFVDFLKAHGLHQLIRDKSVFVNDEGNLILAI
ncbi:hypothetical protein PR048_031876 [Dryococelus australis]|uniref:Integrase catalytic domain-containing protein n=1 Tax=Dryococelus australis TaxID=614101 RepID=A0ABQ9G7H7_9NEOP|nr:hypothetical protein PR048_031876 [Dryococelus australis]